MFSEHHDRQEVARYVQAVRGKLAAGELDQPAAAAAQAVGRSDEDPAKVMLDVLPDAGAGKASSGEEHVDEPFFAREPAVSLLQTALNAETHAQKPRGLIGRLLALLRRYLHPQKFGPDDSDWVTDVGAAMLDRLAKGNHPFNPEPADYAIEQPDPLVVVVGDWGSALPRARNVATQMARVVTEAQAAGRSVHVVHLGDVYYSGDPGEYRRHVLAPGLWPVSPAQADAGVTSWSLNGNHDMYAGGWGFFQTLLADARFRCQRSPDGRPTSYFRIRTPSWDIVGLDTSWDPDVLTFGQVGVLEDPQAAKLAAWAAESDRPLMLLSHHQYLTAYSQADVGPLLGRKLGPLLDRVAVWIWGHEHRCMAFEKVAGQPHMRCIGHGGVPVLPSPEGGPPKPGSWQTAGTWSDKHGTWASFGFAVLDFAGERVTVRYLDDAGGDAHPPETLP